MKNLFVLFILSSFFIVDIYVDLKDGISILHVLHEVFLLLLGILAISWQIKTISRKDKHINELSHELLETKQEYQEWKTRSHSYANEFRNLIDDQFGIWHLSQSEKDVALLLIKGFSMKEIAQFRNTQEKTVRQQATSIYKKAELSGRQELAAFFLEDILSSPLT